MKKFEYIKQHIMTKMAVSQFSNNIYSESCNRTCYFLLTLHHVIQTKESFLKFKLKTYWLIGNKQLRVILIYLQGKNERKSSL